MYQKVVSHISIRAPARGATRSNAVYSRLIFISIRAPARGATICSFLHSIIHGRFQSALPRGERPRRYSFWVYALNFNPRSREGSDYVIAIMPVLGEISIRAPARGATYWYVFAAFLLLFQSALPRGERRRRSVFLVDTPTFQSALPRGERRPDSIQGSPE